MEERCHKNSDCYMCWNSCRLFQGNSPVKSTLCSDPTACFPGCQAACKFYHDSSPKNLTPPSIDNLGSLPAFMAPPRLSEGQLFWNPPSWPKDKAGLPQNEVMMYIVMINVEGNWNQHIQTSSPRATIPDAIREAAIRVLAVTSSGLVAAAERAPRHAANDAKMVASDGDLNHSERDLRRFLMSTTTKKLLQEGSRTPPALANERFSYDYDHNEEREPPSVTVDHSWKVKLKLLSVDMLASVEVSWDLRGSEQVDYQVTWTESSGSIAGHLVTRQDKVEISLWPRQRYSVQVELLDKQGNTVLKSVPKAISFLPDGFSEIPPPPRGSDQDSTTEVTPKNISAPTVVVRSPSFFDLYSPQKTVVEPAFEKSENSPPRQIESPPRLWLGRNEQDTKHPVLYIETTTFSPMSSSPPWQEQPFPNGDPPANSGKVENFNTNTAEKSPSPLMAWTACLSVGAVVIVVLITLAVRSLRRSASKRRKMRSDFFSETTASSVNSSNVTTCSQLSRAPQQEIVKVEDQDGESRWDYETCYEVSHHIPGTVGLQQRAFHSPNIVPPPPDNSLCPLRQSRSHFLLDQGHPLCLVTPALPPLRVDNTSFIENCVVTLDPSPRGHQTDY